MTDWHLRLGDCPGRDSFVWWLCSALLHRAIHHLLKQTHAAETVFCCLKLSASKSEYRTLGFSKIFLLDQCHIPLRVLSRRKGINTDRLLIFLCIIMYVLYRTILLFRNGGKNRFNLCYIWFFLFLNNGYHRVFYEIKSYFFVTRRGVIRKTNCHHCWNCHDRNYNVKIYIYVLKILNDDNICSLEVACRKYTY